MQNVTRYKLVNTFNGWESEERYDSQDEAQEAVEEEKRLFYERNPNATATYDFVLETAVWQFNHVANQWMWDEPY